MIELLTMVIVFGSIIAIVAIVSWFSYKEEELKTSLRLREMEAGFEPGTYSRISKRDLRRARRMAKKASRMGRGGERGVQTPRRGRGETGAHEGHRRPEGQDRRHRHDHVEAKDGGREE